MSIVVRYKPVGMTKAQYDEVVRRFQEQAGDAEIDGFEYHVCFGDDGNLLVSEIFASREAWEAYTEQLYPIIDAVGIDRGGEPDVLEIHNIISAADAPA
jgi:hypothetical protein